MARPSLPNNCARSWRGNATSPPARDRTRNLRSNLTRKISGATVRLACTRSPGRLAPHPQNPARGIAPNLWTLPQPTCISPPTSASTLASNSARNSRTLAGKFPPAPAMRNYFFTPTLTGARTASSTSAEILPSLSGTPTPASFSAPAIISASSLFSTLFLTRCFFLATASTRSAGTRASPPN